MGYAAGLSPIEVRYYRWRRWGETPAGACLICGLYKSQGDALESAIRAKGLPL